MRFARVKVPADPAALGRSCRRADRVPARSRTSSRQHLEQLFPGLELLESHAFRVTRDADVERHEEPAEDLLESIQEELRERRFAAVVRLEVVPEMPAWMRALLADELEIEPTRSVRVAGRRSAARDLFQLAALPVPGLVEPPGSR